MGLAPPCAAKANAKSVLLHTTSVTSLRTSLHVADLQRCEHVGELAARAPSLPLTVLRLCHLSPPLSPPVVTHLAGSLNASPCMPAIVLYYYSFQGSTVRLEMLSLLFVCLFFMYYLCEKYYKPTTAQCYIAAGSNHTRPYP